MSGWTPADLPDLDGARVVVTGANSGLGLQEATELARHGAVVVLACRDPHRGDEALGQVRVASAGRGSASLVRLDLADLGSVRQAAAQILDGGHVDVLVNNAGVMAVPRRTTADGFELQLGTNHLGHFALTGLLLPGLLSGGLLGGPARVVTVSSLMHRMGALHRDDLMSQRRYSPWLAYGQAKLANLLFALELDRRCRAGGVRLASLAAHPGYAATNLQTTGPKMAGNRLMEKASGLANVVFAQPAEKGAWPVLRAAADPAATGGEYYGPGGLGESRGNPKRVGTSRRAADPDAAAWLWQRSVELTGVDFAALTKAA